jgi:hypothetical protein
MWWSIRFDAQVMGWATTPGLPPAVDAMVWFTKSWVNM